MLPERRFILQQVEPLAVRPICQSGPLARERPDLPLEPREGPLALNSKLLRERLKLPKQVVQPTVGRSSAPYAFSSIVRSKRSYALIASP